jgi:hypothetical protein
MIDDPNVPPPAIENDAVAQPTASEPVTSRLNANAEDQERDALTPADYAAAGAEAPDWENDPIPSMDTWRRWQAAQSAALAFKRARAGGA